MKRLRLIHLRLFGSLQASQVFPSLWSVEEQSRGVDKEVVRLCSFEKLSSQGVNQTGGFGHPQGPVFLEFSSLFRKGKVGDWVNRKPHEHRDGRKIRLACEETFKGSGLEF